MAYWTVTLEAPHALADALGDALMSHGALSVEVTDAHQGTAAEQPIFAEPGADSELWNLCRIVALAEATADVAALVEAASRDCELPALDYSLSRLEDADWVALSRAQFQPIEISPRLWIVPSWHEPPVADVHVIRLDPGAAFGTGSHPTTRLCLQWLEARGDALRGAHVIDYGCGSGILAIAALKLGAASALGVDIDVQAVDAAQRNAADNHVVATFRTVNSAVAETADVVLANILANPLKVLAPALAGHTRPGGHLVLAGLLDDQADDLIQIYQPWFALAVWRSSEGWACLAGPRRG